MNTVALGAHVYGGVVAAWGVKNEPGVRVSFQSAANSAWSTSQLIAVPAVAAGGSAEDLQLEGDGQGNAVVAWSQLNRATPGYRVIWAARFNGDLGQWEPPRIVSHTDGSDNMMPTLASDGEGRVALAWRRSDLINGLVTHSVWLSTNINSGWRNWSVPSRVSNAVPANGERIGGLALGAAGRNQRVTVAWSARGPVTGSSIRIWGRSYGLGTYGEQIPASPVIIADVGVDDRVRPMVAVDGAGIGWVAWDQFIADGRAP
ncbi:hypothetical protein WDZ92_29690, partial [Nostoc sp. NIES-2111]